MKISKITKNATLMGLVVLMSNIPNVVLAERLITLKSQKEMISSSDVLAQITRVEAEKEVRDYLQKTVVQSELLKQGISVDEVSARLANLSEQELRQLSGQVKQAQAGGDILVAILLVVLIIYLIKRI